MDSPATLPNWQTRYPRTAPKISKELFLETLSAYQLGMASGLPPANSAENPGRRTAIDCAARMLDLNRETVRQRLAWGRYFTGEEVPGVPSYPNSESYSTRHKREGFTPPELPPEELDGEAIMEQAVSEFTRRRAAEKARNWMPYQVEGNMPFALVYVGDPHLDDPNTDLPRLQRDIRIIQQTPRMWAVGLGDYVNGWVGRLTRKYGDQSVTQRGSYAMAKWLFSLDIWWLLIKGNHDAWAGGGSPLDWMLDSTEVPLPHWEAKFRVCSPKHEWQVWAAHDFPGTSQWNILHGPLKRAMMTGAIADLFVCGDKHSYGVLHTQHEHTGRPYWIGRARGYKLQDDYSRQCGYGEMDIGHSIAAVHDPRTGKMVCFDDVEIAASYLRFLQGGG